MTRLEDDPGGYPPGHGAGARRLAMSEYALGFKEAMVKKMSSPEAKSATELAQEVGVPQSTLSRWLRDFGSLSGEGTEGTIL